MTFSQVAANEETRTVRRLLYVLVAAVTVPLLALAVVAMLASVNSDRLREEARLTDVAQAAAAAVDREFVMAEAFLWGLATSPSLLQDLPRFDSEARRSAPSGTYVVVYTADGRQLVNTFFAPGTQAFRGLVSGNAGHIVATARRGTFTISGLFRGALSNEPFVMASVPIETEGGEIRVVSLVFPAERLGAIYGGRNIAPGWVAAVLDQNRITVARTQNAEAVVGRRATAPVVAALAEQEAGLLRGVRTADGVPAIIAYARAPFSGYATAVAIPDAFFTAALRRSLLPLLVTGTALVIVSLALAAGMSRELLSATQKFFSRSEGLLRQQIRELEGVYDTAPIGLALLDRDLRYLRINPELARSNGPSVTEHLGRSVFDVLPHLRDTLGPIFHKVLAGETVRDQEFIGRHAEHPGDRFVWRGHYYPIRDDTGAVIAVGVVAEDVTPRYEAERELARRSQELETIIQTVPAAMWFASDPAGDRVISNRFAARMARVEEAGAGAAAGAGPKPPIRRALDGEILREAEHRVLFADGGETTVLVNAVPIRNAEGAITGAVAVALDITDRKVAEQTQRLLMHELQHRAKNVLATVQAIIRSTARSAADVAEYERNLTARIVSLGRTHSLLSDRHGTGALVGDLVGKELDPYGRTADSVALDGPAVTLPTDIAVPFGMAIHELATNAAKHGALSVPAGRVRVAWRLEGEGTPRLHLDWTETGGPPVTPPARRGFGSQLLEGVLTAQLGAEVSVDYATDGLRITIALPLPAGAATTGPDDAAAETAGFRQERRAQ